MYECFEGVALLLTWNLSNKNWANCKGAGA